MLSDTLTIGLVLFLLFGSIALYLYTCIQQSEQKVSLLESILLDLKMSAEIKSFTELPSDSVAVEVQPLIHEEKMEEYQPFDDGTEMKEASEEVSEITEEPLTEVQEETNYESMSLKELQALAKSRGIVGVTKKGPLIEALKTSDKIRPGSTGSSSFLENSAPVSDESL